MCKIIAAATILAVGLTGSALSVANIVTMDFSGDVLIDFPIVGLTSHTFEGSVSWDPASAPIGIDEYSAAGATIELDSVDYSGNIANPTIEVFVHYDLSGQPTGADFEFAFDFSPFVFLSFGPITGPPVTGFLGDVFALSLTTNALPDDLNFLGGPYVANSAFNVGEGEFAGQAQGTLTVAAPSSNPPGGGSVPEPGALALLALPLVLLMRREVGAGTKHCAIAGRCAPECSA